MTYQIILLYFSKLETHRYMSYDPAYMSLTMIIIKWSISFSNHTCAQSIIFSNQSLVSVNVGENENETRFKFDT